MKLIRFKSVFVLSNGSLNFKFKNLIKSQSLDFFEKDFKNLPFNKKLKTQAKTKQNYFSISNNKYLNF